MMYLAIGIMLGTLLGVAIASLTIRAKISALYEEIDNLALMTCKCKEKCDTDPGHYF